MRIRRPSAHLWLAGLYVLTLVLGGSGWTAGALLGLVVLWRLIVMRRRALRETSESSLAGPGHTAILLIDLHGFERPAAFRRTLRLAVASPGLPARLGPDRFAVVLPGLDSPERAYEVAGRIAASVAPVVVAGRLAPMTASIGVAVSGPGEVTHDVLMHRASVAMAKAGAYAPETRWAAWRPSYEEAAGPVMAA